MSVIFTVQFADRTFGPVLPLFLAELDPGLSASRVALLAGLLFSMSAGAGAAGNQVAARLLATVRPRRLLVICAGVAAAASLCYALAGSVWLLFLITPIFGAAIGLATDPDVDRLALVDERARAIGEDYTLALAARVVLRRKRGPVVANLSTSRIVDDMVAEYGIEVVRAPVGEVNVAVRMRDEVAVVGGEGNGGVILPELHLGRDAPLAAALMLQLLVDEGLPLSGIVSRFPQYRIVKDKLDRPDGSLEAVYESLRAVFPDATASDRPELSGDCLLSQRGNQRPAGKQQIVM